MKAFCCEKCGSVDVFIVDKPPHKGLYCGDCGSFIKWLGKTELLLAERFIKSNKATKDGE